MTLAADVTRYGNVLNAHLLDRHGVSSPLGVWLLLALLAPRTSGAARDELEDVLGCTAANAAQKAVTLLANPHPAVKAALAAWTDDAVVDHDVFDAWAGAVPALERGPIPSQADADAWARRVSDDLISSFPLQVTPDTAVVLASALATKVTWSVPFEEAPASDLGGLIGEQPVAALRTPAGGAHKVMLARSDVGVVGVHMATSADGLLVASVIGDVDVPAADMHAAAAQVVTELTSSDGGPGTRVPLFDAPLGSGHAWTLTEQVTTRDDGRTRVETSEALLPAWDARSKHRLERTPGVGAALGALTSFTRQLDGVPQFDAAQSAVASYGREGFEAAAVTAFALRACAAAPVQVSARERHLQVRFNRPYAVLALTRSRAWNGRRTQQLTDPVWDGLPVFTAWVEHGTLA